MGNRLRRTIKAYNIGVLGIDIVNSPVHVEDTALLGCQNAQVSNDDKELAIKKRDGMSKINDTAAAGRLLNIINIPIQDPGFIDPGWQPEGLVWNGASTVPTHPYNDVAWSPTLQLFCAVGDAGVIVTSPDADTWTERTHAHANPITQWNTVVWAEGLGKFVVAGNSSDTGGWLQTSDDGITWSIPATLPATSQGYGVDWAESLGRLLIFPYSTSLNAYYHTNDLVTFTLFNPTPQRHLGMSWSEPLTLWTGVWTNLYANSADGASWTESAAPTGTWVDICWSDDFALYIAVAGGSSSATGDVMTSPDGTTWSTGTPSSTDPWNGVATYGELICAVGQNSDEVMRSEDGSTWSSVPAYGSNMVWEKICFAPEIERIVAVASSGGGGYKRIMWST